MVEKFESGYYNKPLPLNTGTALTDTLTVTDTAQEVKSGSSRLQKRVGVYLQNVSTSIFYWGFSSTDCHHMLYADVDSDGRGRDIWIDIGDNQAIWIKTASGTGTLAFSEVA